MSAVSKKLTPSSRARSTTAAECSLSIFMPKLLVPRPASETCRPERPRFLYSTGLHRHGEVDVVAADLRHDALGGGFVGLDEGEPWGAHAEADGVEGVLDGDGVAGGGHEHGHQGEQLPVEAGGIGGGGRVVGC